MTHSTSIAGASACRSASSWPDEPDDPVDEEEVQPASAASTVITGSPATRTHGNLAVMFTGQLVEGSGLHTFGHMRLLTALSTHVAMVCSGLKSELIG